MSAISRPNISVGTRTRLAVPGGTTGAETRGEGEPDGLPTMTDRFSSVEPGSNQATASRSALVRSSTIPVTGKPWFRCHCTTALRVSGPKKLALDLAWWNVKSMFGQLAVKISDLIAKRSNF